MFLNQLILVIVICINLIHSIEVKDDFKEELFLKPLLPTHVYAYFQFITLVDSKETCK